MKIVIPARLASQRLPEKPLAVIAGKPMIVRVMIQAMKAAASRQDVVVAVDSEKIKDAVEAYGGFAVLTSARHESGTDRVAEVAAIMGWRTDEIIVNLQGDEPLMPPVLIKKVADLLKMYPAADIATLAHPIADFADIDNPNAVKVVRNKNGEALYFSRAPIPALRSPDELDDIQKPYLRHIGIYAYRMAALDKMTSLPVGGLERLEKLEQLRALEAGMTIQVGIADEAPATGVDTADDLARVRKEFQELA